MMLPLERVKQLEAGQAPERFDRAGNLIPSIQVWSEDYKRMVDNAIWWHCYRQRTQVPAGIICNVEEFRGAARVRASAADKKQAHAIIR